MKLRCVLAVTAVVAMATSVVSADQTTAGVRAGAGIPTTGMASSFGPTLTVSGWLTGPLRGAIGWRAEIGHDRQRLSGGLRSVCVGAGIACDARVGVTNVGGGLQFSPPTPGDIAPFSYVTVGLYRVSTSASVDGLAGLLDLKTSEAANEFGFSVGGGFRFALTERWGVFAEARYSGFTFGLNDTGWASLLTGAVSLAFGL